MANNYINNSLSMIILLINVYFVSAYPIESENFLVKTTALSSGANTSSSNFILSSSVGDIIGNLSATNRGELGFFYVALAAPSNISKPLTISLWAKRDAGFSKDTPIACKWNRTFGVALRSYCLGIDSDNRTKFYISSDGITFTNVTSSERVPLNRWAFITAVYNNTHIAIYLNGARSASAVYREGYFDTSLPFIIGAGDLNGSERRFFNGTLDEVSLWALALTPTDIQAMFEKDKTRFEFVISNATDFKVENVVMSRLTINNNSQPQHHDDDYTLLLEHFDSKSKILANNISTSGKIRLGKFGNGIEVSGNANLTFTKGSRLNDAEGTIEMWLRPKGNYDNDNTVRFFFDDSNAKFRLYKDSNNNLIWEINTSQLSYDISSWSADTNHHIAVTWKLDKNFSIIIDGELRNQSKLTTIGTSGNLIYIGANSSNQQQANAVIDELRVSSIARLPSIALTNSSYTLQGFEALSEDTYYWRARTTDLDQRIDRITGLAISEWSETRRFSLEIGAPTVVLLYPTNNSYVSTTEMTFNYTPKDTNLDACEFWINASGWKLNQTDLAPVSKGVNTFKLNLSDNPYIWNIQCNDTASNKAFSANNFTVTVDIVEPIVTSISPANNTVDSDANLTFIYNVTDINPIANCSLIIKDKVNITNTSITRDIAINFSTTLDSRKYNWSINCTDNALNVNNTEARIITIMKSTEFTGKTTNFSAVGLESIANLTLENPLYGMIYFLSSVDLSPGYDLDRHINISHARVELNSTALPVLNISANITLYNLTFEDPLVLRDGSTCPSSICNELRYAGGNLTFNVSHFTMYSVVETPVEPAPGAGEGGGGGGGGGGAAVAAKKEVAPEKVLAEEINKAIEVDINKIVEDTRVGRDIVKTFTVKNTGNVELEVSIATTGITILVSAQRFILAPGEQKQITLSFVSDKVGLYTGKIYINADDIQKEIAVSIGVESITALFDISLDVPSEYSQVIKGGTIKAQVTLINILGNTVDVTLNYVIKSIEGIVILEEAETFAVERQSSFVKSFKLPRDINPGTYIIAAELRYANSYAVASKIFEVIEIEKMAPPKRIIIPMIIIGIVIMLSVILYILMPRFRKKSKEEP